MGFFCLFVFSAGFQGTYWFNLTDVLKYLKLNCNKKLVKNYIDMKQQLIQMNYKNIY